MMLGRPTALAGSGQCAASFSMTSSRELPGMVICPDSTISLIWDWRSNGSSRATGRPRSVTIRGSPAAARATTAEAFCFNSRMPTVDGDRFAGSARALMVLHCSSSIQIKESRCTAPSGPSGSGQRAGSPGVRSRRLGDMPIAAIHCRSRVHRSMGKTRKWANAHDRSMNTRQ